MLQYYLGERWARDRHEELVRVAGETNAWQKSLPPCGHRRPPDRALAWLGGRLVVWGRHLQAHSTPHHEHVRRGIS